MAGSPCFTGNDQHRTALDPFRDDRGGSCQVLSAALSADHRVRHLLVDRSNDFFMVETGPASLTARKGCTKLMKQTITDFDVDENRDWRAKLGCGQYQHVRHDPPLISREWTLSATGREQRIGAELECRKCDDRTPRDCTD